MRTIPARTPLAPRVCSLQLIVVLFICMPIGSRRDAMNPNRLQNATSLRGWNVAYEPSNFSLPVPDHATPFRPPVDCCFVLMWVVLSLPER